VLSQFEAAFKPLLVEVAQKWWPSTPDVSLKVVELFDKKKIGQISTYGVYQSNDHHLLFKCDETAWAIAISEWVGCQIDQPSPLAKELQHKFISEIINAIATKDTKIVCHDADKAEEIIERYSRPGSGGVIAEITINNATFRILTTAALFPSLIGKEDRVAKFKLADAREAINGSSVVLEARLPSAKLPIMQVSSISEGDFINLQMDLSGKIILTGKDIDISITAELGQRDGHKAALVISESRK
jgi:hypothetical protein